MTPLILDTNKTEPVKKLSNELFSGMVDYVQCCSREARKEKGSMIPRKVNQGKDGKIREVCGPGIAKVLSRHILSVVQLRQKDNSRNACDKRKILRRGKNTMQEVHQICDRRPCGNDHEEPEPAEVKPTFRTPPDFIRIGLIDLSLHGKITLHAN